MKAPTRYSLHLPLALLAALLVVPPCSRAADAPPVPDSLKAAITRLHQPGGARALLEQTKAQVHRDIPYVSGGHERQKLDLYIPAACKGVPLPLVCFIHGGGWRNGQKSVSQAVPLLSQGYAVAGIGYRLTDAAPFPAQIHDCKAAIRWLRANASKYGIDPDRIGVWGSSAGGHLSALLGTSGDVSELEGDLGNQGVSSRVQAVCDFYGPADFLLGDVGGRSDNPTGPVALLLGGAPSDRRDVARSASPTHWITADDAPFLIFQGGQDRTVPPIQSQKFAERLKGGKVEVELVEFPEAGHGGPPFSTPETVARILAFFDRHLKASSARPSPGN